MKLIPDWHKKLHKLWTTRLSALGAALAFAADNFSTLQGVLPDAWYKWLFIAIFLGRLVAQDE